MCREIKLDLTNVIVCEAHSHEVFGWAVVIHLVTSVKIHTIALEINLPATLVEFMKYTVAFFLQSKSDIVRPL